MFCYLIVSAVAICIGEFNDVKHAQSFCTSLRSKNHRKTGENQKHGQNLVFVTHFQAWVEQLPFSTKEPNSLGSLLA